jgi:F-type H+-transporting ATPase subunit b
MEPILDFLQSLHFHPVVFAAQLILFTGFHFAMRATIYDPLLNTRNERDGRIDGHLATAEASAANARAMKQKYEEEIRAQRAALAQQLKEAIDKSEDEAAEVLKKARAEADRVTDEASAKLNEEEQQLQAGMDEQAGQVALAVARRVVRNSLTEDAQERVLAQLKG